MDSSTLFDRIPTEILFEIFEYLSCTDILYAFFDYNQRLNSILLQHKQYSSTLESPTADFYVWDNILLNIGSHIQHLRITTVDFDFSLKLFSNLKYLIISSPFPVNYERLYSLFESQQFHQLIFFKIQSEIFHRFDHYGELEGSLFKTIFNHQNSLEIFQSSSKLHASFLRNIPNLEININLRSLSLKLTNFINVFPLLDYTPNLKYLNLIVTSFCTHDELYFSQINLEKFIFTTETIRSSYGSFEQYFLSLTNLIKRFSSSLIYLSIDLSRLEITHSYGYRFDGNTLQQQLLESMTQLKTFHFYARLDLERFINVNNFLSTFENQFWFDHHWSIGIHGQYFYTLPFHFDKLNDFIDFDHIKSNNLMILQSPCTWYRVISIEFCESFELNSNLIEQLKLKMPNLRTIILHSMRIINNRINLTLDSVTTVNFTGNHMKNIPDILPNLKELILSEQNQFIPIVNERIERLKIINVHSSDKSIGINDIYFPNVKYIEIRHDHYRSYDILKILKNFKNLKMLMFYFRWYGYDSENTEGPDLSHIFGELNLIEILENYQIKHVYDCCQFIKKQNDD
jgi:hypothetical protein